MREESIECASYEVCAPTIFGPTPGSNGDWHTCALSRVKDDKS